MAKRNYNKLSKILALEQIFTSTNILFDDRRVEFGIPMALDTRIDIKTDHNTYCDLDIDVDYDTRFGGNTGFLYRRVRLEEVLNTKPFINTRPYPFKTSDILNDINIQYELQLKLDDVVERLYSDPSEPFKISANPISLFWISDDTIMQVEKINLACIRLLEDGSVRYTEDELPRLMEWC